MDSILYSGRPDIGGKGARSCADLKTDAIEYMICRNVLNSRVLSLCAVTSIQRLGSSRERRGENGGGGSRRERVCRDPSASGIDG